MDAATDWAKPDRSGIQCRVLNRQHTHRQHRSAVPPDAGPVATWPGDWRELLGQWLRSSARQRSWNSLRKIAGNARYPLLHDLLRTLLEAGWIVLDERRGRDWQPHHIEWCDADGLREALGLPRRDARVLARGDVSARAPQDPRLHALHASLAGMSINTALRRAPLIEALDHWLASQRSGTRRQFAWHARGDTKGLSDGEWDWLAQHVELEGLGISQHAPALWLRAPLRLCAQPYALDLRMVPDAIGLSPLTIAAVEAIEGDIEGWLVLENRTSFEQVAREAGNRYGVLWLPGFAPSWWFEAVDRLLRWIPRPAWIAADPDPAGIDIALRAGELWQAQALDWCPWAMDDRALVSLARHKPLTEYDRQRLCALAERPLPAALRRLADALVRSGRKGEQEGIDLLGQLPDFAQATPREP